LLLNGKHEQYLFLLDLEGMDNERINNEEDYMAHFNVQNFRKEQKLNDQLPDNPIKNHHILATSYPANRLLE
jgi:hypothetical protein